MGSDPTPGDPDRVRELAEKLQAFADDASDALGKVRDLVGDDSMAQFVGQTAEAFKDRFDKVPPNLTKLYTSYDLAAQALARYWPKLEDAQRDADTALEDATEAKSDLDSAQTVLAAAAASLEDAEDAAEDPDEDAVAAEVRRALTEAESAHSGAESTVASARERLEAAKGLAQQAKEAREEAAEACANDLDEASDAGMQNKKWWQKAVDWVVDNWDTIVEIAKIVVAVLGVIVMIIGGPLAWVVLAAALIVLADTLIDYANGNASLWDVAFAALDCIPGFKGLTTVAGLAGGVKKYVSNFKNMKSMFQAQGIRGIGKVLIGDPIDIATGEMTLRNTDVELPGVLPLALEREHLSHYRNGRWFGRSWASTLDQRLTLNQWGVDYYADDGMILHYPIPKPDYEGPVMPVSGPRWGLTWDGKPGSPITLEADAGRTLHFAPVPGRPGAELPIAAITDRNTNRIDFRYTENGDPCEVTHSGGYRIGIAVYDNRITSLTLLSDPDQPVLRAFDYDTAGNLAAVYNSSGLPLLFEYDDKRRMTRWEDRNHTWYSYEYDPAGKCVFTTGTDRALEYRYHYDTDNLRTTATNSLGHATTYQMNEDWQVITETDPLGHTTHKTWDEYNRLLAVTDPLGRTTRYAYDDHGNLGTVTHPDDGQTASEYVDPGMPSEVIYPDGSRWQFSYDARGNRVAALDPAGNRSRYTYGDQGGLISVTDALGHTTRIRCDGAGLPLTVADAAGGTTTVSRDSFGRPVRITDPNGATSRLEWSVEGKLLRHTDPLGNTETFEWDAEGNLLSHHDPSGGITSYRYGPFDLPVSQTSPDGVSHTFVRDTELKLVQVVNPHGATWDYSYDAAGRLASESDFDQRVTAYTRDALGRLTRRTNAAGQSISYQLDRLGQVIAKATSDGNSYTYTYDPVGRITAATAPGVELSRTYDPLGNLLTETINGRTLRLAYDATGQLTERVTPAGHRSSWSYTATGTPASLVTDGRTLTFDHDAAGQETARHIGGTLTLQQQWDGAGRLARQTLAGPAAQTIAARSYSYRADGYLVGIDDHTTGRHTFTLDATGRVAASAAPGWHETYAYDLMGNQTDARWPLSTTSPYADATGERGYEGSLLTRAGSLRYEHDAAGRTVQRQKTRLSKKPETWRYAWNAEDQLSRTVTPDGTVWQYVYDPFGRRLSKQRLAADDSDGTAGTDGAAATRVAEQVDFTWHGATLIEQTSGDGAVLTWNHREFHPLTQTEHTAGQDETDRRFYAIVTDLVGTPAQLVDESGDTAWRSRSTHWGATATAPGSTTDTPLRFPGQYADAETGWHYNFRRHYDPTSARYTAPDPLGLEPSPHHYGYVHNPHLWIDPLGLAAHPEAISSRFTQADNAAHIDANPAGNAYSGIYNPRNGSFEGRLSGAPEVPGAVLPRRGGHGRLNAGMFDDSRETVGFTAVIQEGGSLNVTWLSRSVTGRNYPGSGGIAPPEHQQAILDALSNATGRTVTG
jgi:RHS repeat-associated protein